MRHRYLSKIPLVGFGVALSFVLAILAFSNVGTPGAYVAYELFPPGGSGQYDLRLVLLIHIGVDSLLCFSVLSGLYLLFTKLPKREGK
jgi:hypothetical protein